ncbi:DUF7684 family protein [Mucilaginibacter psychrotolerans]|uniref:DUF7684 domain-containing protein n=1 Tax=Mucilaginibacter psychrotolerans TaxID=1524096 RepID=A0A4Y8SQD8_9SPHI|nr:hypothetical protein [Mucilaginibacter psychrotolerans]TFF40664.1 hypothetical protein E2R66_00320 [Mucilaginibacter psychrotolerans]
MIDLATVNNRKVFYQRYDTETPWSTNFPTENWLAFVLVDNQPKTKLFEISNKLIGRNACYVCATGEQSELMHDIVDEDIVYREVDIDYEYNYLPPFDIITTWHNTIQEGLWFAIYAACNDPIEIDKIVCLNASDGFSEPEIRELLLKFTEGYIPD